MKTPKLFLDKVLEQLAADKSTLVRQCLAGDPNTPAKLFLELMLKLYDRSSFNPIPSLLRFLVLLHPQAPAQALTDNFRSLAWLERYAIAQNSNTPLSTLQALAKDGNRIVRAAAKANLQNR